MLMMAPDIAREAKQAIALIKAFSLELAQYSPESQVMYWLNTYRPTWIRDAIIEAVFQGRYKIISVQHILAIWQRRGQPVCHFTSGFEQIIASHLGSPIHMSTSMMTPPKAEKSSQPNSYSFAPSPLSSSVVTFSAEALGTSTGQETATLSIDAFPVEPVDNLVEIYKATAPGQMSRMAEPEYHNTTTSSDFHMDEMKSLSHSSSQESRPIQPFRPTALPNGTS